MPNANTPTTEVAQPIAFAPLALGLPDCRISIEHFLAEAPDRNNSVRVTYRYKITNDSERDWDYLSITAQILTASGQIIDSSDDQEVVSIKAGAAEEQIGVFWCEPKLLGNNSDQMQLVINVTACGLLQERLGVVEIPANPFEVVTLDQPNLGNFLQVVNGSMWSDAPNDDKEVMIYVKALMQNLSSHHFRQVFVDIQVKDKMDAVLLDENNPTEIRPSVIGGLSASTYPIKPKLLKGAVADIKVRAYVPLAEGYVQQSGF